MPNYIPRIVDHELGEAIREHPAILLVGPRGAGKTTTARRHASSIVHLDMPAEAAAFAADADAALASFDEPVLLDEWQAVPEVLAAVKRAVDDDRRPGRFVLTGSVRADLEAETWPGTGRLVRLPMHTFNQRELVGRTSGPNPIDVIAAGDALSLEVVGPAPTLPEYVDLSLRGGYPEAAIELGGRGRQRWLTSYLEQLITRDAVDLSGRDPARLARYFEVLALNSAGIVSNTTLYEAANIDKKTADAYDRLLSDLFVLDAVPAWFTNRLTRLVKAPKRYVTDPSLVGAALRIDLEGVLRDGDLLGRLLDTFVAAQLRPELAASAGRPRLFHVREKNGRHEVDLLAEFGGGRVVAIEVKATAAPNRGDAAHLEWMRDRLGERFLAGVVFHSGPAGFALTDQVAALPIASLWSPGGAT
jgi:predicted AAA+ superfamily ATPase